MPRGENGTHADRCPTSNNGEQCSDICRKCQTCRCFAAEADKRRKAAEQDSGLRVAVEARFGNKTYDCINPARERLEAVAISCGRHLPVQVSRRQITNRVARFLGNLQAEEDAGDNRWSFRLASREARRIENEITLDFDLALLSGPRDYANESLASPHSGAR
ncbi:hypothetical protein EAI_13183 [Harpegnathos saltator]|uniref:Uncharacterized protein n=1 Tax=Harpegnathos saltator TaxID=610380 RepID=E2BIJ7_HARSA|nr:hypothetical protein EAI_13183 [Harpegnathos saltator]